MLSFYFDDLLCLVFQHSDMVEEMKSECIDFSITACEKYAANYEVNHTRNITNNFILNFVLI